MSKSKRAILRSGIVRPVSLRQKRASLVLGMSAALLAGPALAQSAEPDEVELDTLRIEDKAADVNPYTQKGAPYKARVSGDPRRVKPLAETPATIQVLTATQIEESGETDLRDVLDGVPGVTVGTGENGNAFGDRYIIRGQEVRSDVFVDGLRDPGMTTRESFAVEQIEVTKGPSSSFGGRGTTGGAVNSITKQASTDYNFNRVDLGVGTDNFWRGTLGVWDQTLPPPMAAPYSLPLPLKWGTPTFGGPMLTAGGLVFIGATGDDRLRAFDLRNGKEIWNAILPTGAFAVPMSYEIGGRQFVVVASGGHAFVYQKAGDQITAFALPEAQP